MLGKFWLKMAGMFGHSWVSQYGDCPGGDAAETWAAMLEGLTGEQIAHGLRAVRSLGSEWPPSGPKFRALCFDIPSFAAVRHDLRNGSRDRMPFTRLAWEFLDGYAFARAEQDRAERMLRDAYELARKHVMDGGELPELAAELAHEAPAKPVPASPEKVAETMAEIARTLDAAGDVSCARAFGEG